MFELGVRFKAYDGMAGTIKKQLDLQKQFREQLSSTGIEIGKLKKQIQLSQHTIGLQMYLTALRKILIIYHSRKFLLRQRYRMRLVKRLMRL